MCDSSVYILKHFLALMCKYDSILKNLDSIFDMIFLSEKAVAKAINRVVLASYSGGYSLEEEQIVARYCGQFPVEDCYGGYQSRQITDTNSDEPEWDSMREYYYGHIDIYLEREQCNAKSVVFNQLIEIDRKFNMFRDRDAILLIFACHCIELYDEPLVQVILQISY